MSQLTFRRTRLNCVLFVIVFILLGILTYPLLRDNPSSFEINDFRSWSDWDNTTGFPYMIVPNIVHFIKFRKHELKFVELIVVLSAWCHQRPERIIIHCDCDDLTGPHWQKIKGFQGIEVRRIIEPTEVFGIPLNSNNSVFHAGDIARIAVLQEYGGIILDFDTYVVKNLNQFRHFECTIAWPPEANLGCQIIISHKDARFIHLYRESYHYYNASLWYYNAGQLPTRILELLPHLIHRVPWKLGVHQLRQELYNSTWPEWKEYFTIHLLAHKSQFQVKVDFDFDNIRNYPYTFGEMARLVLFGSTEMVPHNKEIEWDYRRCRDDQKPYNSDFQIFS